MQLRRSILIGSLTLSLVSRVLAADEASTEARDRARQWMDVGHARFEKGEYAEALDAYRSADRIMMVPTTKLGVARSLIELGKFVEAREVLAGITRTSPDPDEPPAFERAREKARELTRSLVARIPTVTLTLPARPPRSLAVTLDGKPVATASVDAPLQADPGAHVLVVTAPGHLRFTAELTLAEGANHRVEVLLERRASSTPSTDREEVAAGSGGSEAEPRADEVEASAEASAASTHSNSPRATSVGRAWSWVGVGLGGASLLVGAFAGGMTFIKVSELENACPGRRCPESARGLHDTMASYATCANVALPIGAALFGAGLVGVTVTSGASRSPTAVIRLAPNGLTLEGRF
ncbi:MAG: hypothetical protein FJ096_20175 [Deltaproteobacteria bacterium]|nr:hypothetical protein [Deltaproteobacteria bacterium]